jgi:hypothetical protein
VLASGVALSQACQTCSCCTVASPEIKTQAGELSDPQQSVMAAVLASGGRVGVVRDAEEMLVLLDAWGCRAQRT